MSFENIDPSRPTRRINEVNIAGEAHFEEDSVEPAQTAETIDERGAFEIPFGLNAPDLHITPLPGGAGSSDPEPYEVYVSSEISERAPTKDRPDPTYGTTTKVTLNFDVFPGAETVRRMLGELHAVSEIALQDEIRRRLFVRIAGVDDEQAEQPIDGEPPF